MSDDFRMVEFLLSIYFLLVVIVGMLRDWLGSSLSMQTFFRVGSRVSCFSSAVVGESFERFGCGGFTHPLSLSSFTSLG
jgi:hypothetical protein